MRWRTMLALLCVFLTLAQGCLAFSGTVDALDAAESLTLTVGRIEIQQLTGTDQGRQVLNNFLTPLSLGVAMDADTARLSVLSGNEETASLKLTGSLWPDTQSLPYEALRRVFAETLPALFDACIPEEDAPEPEVRNASVKNLPRSTQRTTLTVTPAQLAASPAVAQIRDSVALMAAHLPQADEITAWADHLEAVSSLTVKRLENAEGEPVAWQVTGRVASGGKDTRQMTLYGGINGLSAYISLKLPARSGKNDFELVISLKDQAGKKKNAWSGTVTFKRVMNGNRYTVTDTVNLTDEHAAGEEITGSVKREVVADGVKTVWTLKPELAGDGHSLNGTLSITKKYAQTQVWQMTMALSAREGTEPGGDSAADMSEFTARFMEYLMEYRGKLAPEDQRQLDHMLRTDAWMNGPAY